MPRQSSRSEELTERVRRRPRPAEVVIEDTMRICVGAGDDPAEVADTLNGILLRRGHLRRQRPKPESPNHKTRLTAHSQALLDTVVRARQHAEGMLGKSAGSVPTLTLRRRVKPRQRGHSFRRTRCSGSRAGPDSDPDGEPEPPDRRPLCVGGAK